jgi:hypothetical protein
LGLGTSNSDACPLLMCDGANVVGYDAASSAVNSSLDGSRRLGVSKFIEKDATRYCLMDVEH